MLWCRRRARACDPAFQPSSDVLQFPTNALSSHLESFLKEVHGAPGQALRMPVKLELGGGLGAAVQAVQTVAMWSRLAQGLCPAVLSPSFATQVVTRERFASTLPGMATLYFSSSVTSGNESVDRYHALEAVAPRVKAMQDSDFRNTLRGIGVALVCFAGAKSEFLHPLYSRPASGFVRGHADFRVLLPRVLAQLGAGFAEKLTEGQLELLSALVYQLFLNTDEHAADDVHGRRYATGLRGFTARLTTLDDVPSLVRYSGEDTALRAYLTKLALLPGQRAEPPKERKLPAGPVRLVELSVFDTGPGLALRWLSQTEGPVSYRDFSEERELDAVQSCFGKHATTKASQYSGLGLPMALMAMKRLNAFMTLRTGRMSLYQDFSVGSTEAFDPKRRYPAKQHLAEIAGTGYTVWFKVP